MANHATGTVYRLSGKVGDTSKPGLRVARVLGEIASRRPLPQRIVVDNGPEFAGKDLDKWAYRNGVELSFIRPGRPVDNFVEYAGPVYY